MDINFHYFAVKTLACAAGFSENDAQIIAQHSQFIDDFAEYECRNFELLPDLVKESKYDIYIANNLNYNFIPVTTGFGLSLTDQVLLLTSYAQRFTVSPFHFIPQNINKIKKGDYRCVRASLNDGSFISNLLNDAKTEYQNAKDSKDICQKEFALMRIGMLLHTFADTYAHQLFSGYNESCNDVRLREVFNIVYGRDETQKYLQELDAFLEHSNELLPNCKPSIGHILLNHIPDLSFISWEMDHIQFGEPTKTVYRRSNTEEFIKACHEIYIYLCDLNGHIKKDVPVWDTTLEKKIAVGFLIDYGAHLDKGEDELVKILKPHWENLFKGYAYYYSSADVFETALNPAGSAKSSNDTFSRYYYYNVYAEDLILKLYELNQPRKSWCVKEIINYPPFSSI